MVQINELNEITSLSTDDKFPVWDNAVSATRKSSFSTISDSIKNDWGVSDFGAELVQAEDAGAVLRLLETAMPLSSFGAKLNAVDNSVAISAAAQSGKTVIVDGDYSFASTIIMDVAGTRFESGVHKLQYTGTGNAVQITVVGDAKWLKPPSVKGNACKTITGITKASPAVVTCAGHGLTTGNEVSFGEIEGMTELNSRFATVTVIDANTFSVPIDTTLYSTFTSGWWIKYTSGHRGIFYQETTFSPNVVRWGENIDLDGVNIEGFGDTCIRLDWCKNLRGSFKVSKFGYGGFIGLSIVGAKHDVIETDWGGAGSGGTVYGVSYSRNYGSPAMGVSEAPRSSDIYIGTLINKNNPRYVGFDTHGGERIYIGKHITRNVGVAVNFEHATGGGSTVSVNNVVIGARDYEGCDPTYFDIKPAIYIDAQSGAGEIADGIYIGGGSIKWHGFSNTFSTNIFSDGGAVYLRNCKNTHVVGGDLIACYKRGVLVSNYVNADIRGWSAIDLQSVSGVQRLVDVEGTTSVNVNVDNLNLNGSGYALKVAAAATAVVGGNITLLNGAVRWDSSTTSILKVGAGGCIPDAVIEIRGDTGAKVWEYYKHSDFNITVSRTSAGIYTFDVSGMGVNNARIHVAISAQGAHKILMNNLSSTSNEIRTYDSGGSAYDAPDIGITIWIK